MTTTENPIRNGVDTATLFATLDAVKGNNDIAKFQFRATQQVDQRHPQPVDDPRLLRRHAGDGRTSSVHVFDADHPAVLVGTDNGPDPGRVRAARAGRLPHRRHRQHRRRPRHQPHVGRVDRRGRHRPARHPRPVGDERPQRLPADQGQLQAHRRRPREAAQGRRAVPRSARPSTTSSPTACPSASTSTPAESCATFRTTRH